MALLGEGDVGIFVSVGGFTKDARDEARAQERRKVTLLNNEELLICGWNITISSRIRIEDDCRFNQFIFWI
jgi:hypothetical protein